MNTATALLLAPVLALGLHHLPAHAGQSEPDTATCSTGSNIPGQGFVQGCVGTMRGFRHSADPEAFAELTYSADGRMSFQARINGTFFACVFESSYDAQYFASVAGNFRNTRFVIGARDGRCDMVGATLNIGSRWGSH